MEMCDFYCEKLAPNIIKHVRAYAGFRENERLLSSKGRCPVDERAYRKYETYAARSKWPAKKLPFAYDGVFPPRRWQQLLPLIWTMQMLIWQLVLVFTGAHEHEMLLMVVLSENHIRTY